MISKCAVCNLEFGNVQCVISKCAVCNFEIGNVQCVISKCAVRNFEIGSCVPVYQVSTSGMLTQASYRHKQVLLPEAICCCLQTCKCGFDIRVVLCTSVPSLIVRNANTTKL